MTDHKTDITMALAKKAPVIPSYNAYWQANSRYRPVGNYTPVPAKFNLNNKKFKFPNTMGDWPWSNDPAGILYNEKDGLYYSWAIYRDKQSLGMLSGDWMEMVSKDCINWRQTEKRLEAGVHATSLLPTGQVSFMGGSAWIDRENRFGFGAGAVLFLISMTPCIIGSEHGWIESVALFVAPGGLGTPVDTSKSQFIFRLPQTSSNDWRDTRLQWDKDNNQLLFVISNHQNVQFFANKSRNIKDFQLVQTFDTGYQIGIECPDFRPIVDIATGEKHWLLVCSKQTPGGGAQKSQQTIAWFLGRWDAGTLGRWDAGTLGRWDAGTLGRWDAGTLGRWDAGTLGRWDAGTILPSGHITRIFLNTGMNSTRNPYRHPYRMTLRTASSCAAISETGAIPPMQEVRKKDLSAGAGKTE